MSPHREEASHLVVGQWLEVRNAMSVIDLDHSQRLPAAGVGTCIPEGAVSCVISERTWGPVGQKEGGNGWWGDSRPLSHVPT